ncbi:ABC transporter permease [Rhizobium rhizogenes]|uniref:ABC transporter permease n=1 Tax=Rhizobium rhizogenes TaxID=359 RepID=UPI001572DB5F|nr:ABC transporter permease [Rhizobium rhizogenes]NTI44094.1 ABC transporter permease [Rhizobium rhizogenes]
MIKRLLQNLAVPVVLLTIWQLMSIFGLVRPEILPSPVAIMERLWLYLMPEETFQAAGGIGAWIMSSELLGDLLASLQRVVLGFAVGAGLALPLGLLMGTDKTIERYLNPVIQFLRPIPPIAYIPLAILWFGLGNPPAIFLIAIGAFFPVLINTISGVRNVDSIYVRAATNLGADRLTLFRRVILPAATPYILTGMRIGIGTAFIVVIVAEMIAVNSGLGYRILEAREYMWSDKVIAGMIAIGLLGLAIDIGVNRLNSHLLRWHRGIES